MFPAIQGLKQSHKKVNKLRKIPYFKHKSALLKKHIHAFFAFSVNFSKHYISFSWQKRCKARKTLLLSERVHSKHIFFSKLGFVNFWNIYLFFTDRWQKWRKKKQQTINKASPLRKWCLTIIGYVILNMTWNEISCSSSPQILNTKLRFTRQRF